jgi:hypothetical protein
MRSQLLDAEPMPRELLLEAARRELERLILEQGPPKPVPPAEELPAEEPR